MDTMACVEAMKPDGKWWQWQSDWALGACAKQHGSGILPTQAPRGLFNQFICVDKDHHPFYCKYGTHERPGSTGGMGYTPNELDGALQQPCTIHPIKTAEGFGYLWRHYSASLTHPTRDVTQAREALGIDPAMLLREETRVTTVENVAPEWLADVMRFRSIPAGAEAAAEARAERAESEDGQQQPSDRAAPAAA